MLIHITRRLRLRFARHVELRGGQDNCWRWKATKDKQGYGTFTLGRGRRIAAHRMAFILSKSKDGDVYDTSDIPFVGHVNNCIGNSCVNPIHLTPGKYTDRKLKEDENVIF